MREGKGRKVNRNRARQRYRQQISNPRNHHRNQTFLCNNWKTFSLQTLLYPYRMNKKRSTGANLPPHITALCLLHNQMDVSEILQRKECKQSNNSNNNEKLIHNEKFIHRNFFLLAESMAALRAYPISFCCFFCCFLFACLLILVLFFTIPPTHLKMSIIRHMKSFTFFFHLLLYIRGISSFVERQCQ